jgi:uncharacterized membrane protein
MEEFVKALTIHLASATEAAAALIISFAVLEAGVFASLAFVRRYSEHQPIGHVQDKKEEIRLCLGRWLALALEFELAADILRTAVAPTWNEIGQLAAIIMLRTSLNYFLQREIDKDQARPRP